jgi:probable O-glycosylation ligase (exosortase A-associated)
MRDLAFALAMIVLIPISLKRPIAGVLLFCWISFMSPHQSLYGVAATAPWAMVVVITTMMGMVVAREPKTWPINGVTVAISLFLLCISLTSVVALAPEPMVEAKWEAVFKTFFFLLIVAALVTNKVRIHAMIWVMVLSLGYYGVRGGIFTLLTGGAYRVWGPPNTMIADNNQIAAGLLVALPLLNYLRIYSRHRAVRFALLIASGLTVVAVLGTYSRGALVAIGAVALFMWLNSAHKILSGVVIIAVLAGALSFMPADWLDRMATIENYQTDTSAEGRFAIWTSAATMAVVRPLTGGGFMAPYVQDIVSAYTPGVQARAVHSIYFEVIGEHGFPTFFVWLCITLSGVACTIRIRRRCRRRPDLAWCRDLAKMTQVSIIAYLTAGSLLSMSYWDFYFTLLVVIAATDRYVTDASRARNTAPAVPTVSWRSRVPAPVGAR